MRQNKNILKELKIDFYIKLRSKKDSQRSKKVYLLIKYISANWMRFQIGTASWFRKPYPKAFTAYNQSEQLPYHVYFKVFLQTGLLLVSLFTGKYVFPVLISNMTLGESELKINQSVKTLLHEFIIYLLRVKDSWRLHEKKHSSVFCAFTQRNKVTTTNASVALVCTETEENNC